MAGEIACGKYVLLRKLGSGGMGEVFLARQRVSEGLEKTVVIKRLLTHFSDDPEYLDSLLQEARIQAQLVHPSIVQIFDVGRADDGSFYLAMEFVRGPTLFAVLTQLRQLGERFPPPLVSSALERAADALSYAHAKADGSGQPLGIVHRDVTPHNVILTWDGEVKLIDFGIAKSSTRQQKTGAGIIKGKLGYLSPEQLEGLEVDRRSDIFSLGIVLYECLTGANPFHRENGFHSLDAIRSFQPPPPSSVDPSLAPFDAIAAKALCKDRKGRYSDAGQLRDDLAAARRSLAPAPQPLGEYLRRILPDRHEKEPRMLAELRGNSAVRVQGPEGPEALEPAPSPNESTDPELQFAPPGEPEPSAQAGDCSAVRLSLPPSPSPRQPRILQESLVGLRRIRVIGSDADMPRPPSSMISTRQTTLVPSADGWSELRSRMPPSIAGDAAAIEVFLRASFSEAASTGFGVWRLASKTLGVPGRDEFYLLFLARPDGRLEVRSELATASFIALASPLEDCLARLPETDARKVVVALTDAVALGPGVHRKILEYRMRSRLYVLPICAGEVRAAVHQGREEALQALLRARLDELHAGHDPFSSEGPVTDSTRFFGMHAALNQAVLALARPGAVLAIQGLPGSGKTSLINRVEYAGRHRMVRVRCSNVDEPSVDALVAEIVERMEAAHPRAGGGQVGPADASVRGTLLRIAVRAERAEDPAEVLVIEDADWLLRLVDGTGPAEATQKARQFWKTIARWATDGSMRTIVTGARAFELGSRVIGGWENPLCALVHLVSVPPLDEDWLGTMLVGLGSTIDLEFKPAAAARIYELTKGRIDVARKLCSALARRCVQLHALTPRCVSAQEVESAAEELVALGSSFRDLFFGSLDELERQVLRAVALHPPRSARRIKRTLAGMARARDVEEALERLRAMGLVVREKGRESLPVPLLARWSDRHLDGHEELRRPDRRLAALALGVAATALLFAGYFSWASTRRVARELVIKGTGCRYEVALPESSVPGATESLVFDARCSARQAPATLNFAAIRGTEALDGSGVVFRRDVLDCAGQLGCRPMQVSLTMRAPAPGPGAFVFRMAVEDRGVEEELILSIPVDRFRSSKEVVAQAARIAGPVPAALGAIVAFYSDILALMRRLAAALGIRRKGEAQEGGSPAP